MNVLVVISVTWYCWPKFLVLELLRDLLICDLWLYCVRHEQCEHWKNMAAQEEHMTADLSRENIKVITTSRVEEVNAVCGTVWRRQTRHMVAGKFWHTERHMVRSVKSVAKWLSLQLKVEHTHKKENRKQNPAHNRVEGERDELNSLCYWNRGQEYDRRGHGVIDTRLLGKDNVRLKLTMWLVELSYKWICLYLVGHLSSRRQL